MASKVAKLSDGNEIPLLGLGTFQSPPGVVYQAALDAIDVGYRHFDCADFYENEAEIGKAFNDAIKAGKVTRKELFVTSKVWPTWLGSGRPTLSAKRTLKNLGLDYVDLLLVHWPTPFKQDDNDFYPGHENDQVLFDESIDLVEVWREFERIKAAGKKLNLIK